MERVNELLNHPEFSLGNPNKVRAVVGAFCSANPSNFHAPDGEAYRWLQELVTTLDARNPQLASRLLTPLTHWRRHGSTGGLMRQSLEGIAALPELSPDVYEVVSKSLGDD